MCETGALERCQRIYGTRIIPVRQILVTVWVMCRPMLTPKKLVNCRIFPMNYVMSGTTVEKMKPGAWERTASIKTDDPAK